MSFLTPYAAFVAILACAPLAAYAVAERRRDDEGNERAVRRQERH